MTYLLDTNIISEHTKAKPNQGLLDWLADIPNNSIHLSALSIGEIRFGVERLKDSKKKTKLLKWLEKDLINWFEGRILELDEAVADKWGFLQAQTPRTLSVIDSLIAATALCYNLKLVTRNTKDFKDFQELELINPFQ